MYTRPTCFWCVRAKHLLESKGFSYRDLDINNENLRKELKIKAPGIKTIPRIFKDGKRIGGYEDLVEYFKDK